MRAKVTSVLAALYIVGALLPWPVARANAQTLAQSPFTLQTSSGTGGAGATQCSELSDAGPYCSANVLDAADITTGTLDPLRLTSGAVTQFETELEGVLDLSQLQGDITLGTQTTGPYAGSSTEGGAADTGDSATSFFPAGTLEVARGGTGQGSATDDTALIGNGSGFDLKALVDCTDTGGQHLNYTAATNAFLCGTSGDGSGLSNPLSAGTVGTNAIQIVQTGTGLYQPATNVLGLSANGIDVLRLNTVASGINYITVTPSATGGGANGPILKWDGASTNVDLIVDTKGASSRIDIRRNGATIFDAGAGASEFYRFNGGNGMSVSGWLQTPSVRLNSASTNVSETANGVVGMGTGAAASRAGWANWAGETYLTSNGTNATATMANTGLSITVTSGRKYSFKCILYVNDSVAAEGAKFDFEGGTATATNFRVHGTLYDTALNLSAQTSALATDFASATVTGDAMVEFNGSFEPSANGTFIPRYAQNSHSTGTLTIFRGSYCEMNDQP